MKSCFSLLSDLFMFCMIISGFGLCHYISYKINIIPVFIWICVFIFISCCMTLYRNKRN